MNRWEVYLGRRLINVVYYLPSCDAAWVRDGLINHDGFHPNIRVVLTSKVRQ